jgi:hypothetical protein
MASRSIGKVWQREKRGMRRDALRRKLACYLCAICVLLSVIDVHKGSDASLAEVTCP